ncbi:MAG: homocysteine S-methyltransferase family protein [Anaerolineales bacterium]|nr:homocysteine S-methyltransferase family protein [Anaerolineales bacterium]MCL4260433.1 homocysteine S-methyltransferase family protein [Anaerolineales bacterium]
MNRFLKRLHSGEILVADGATGSNLQKMGLKPGRPPEDLILDDPDAIFKLASSFAEAGSDIILTCTFGGTRMRMKDSKYQERAPEVNMRAAEIARKAAALNNGLVAGSLGPVGALIKPYGPLEFDEVKAAFAEQAKALAAGGVDLLVIETMFAIEETTAAFEGARSMTDLPIVVSFSYDRGTRSMMGVKPKDAIKKYAEMGATLIGANCGTTLDNMEAVVKEYAATLPNFPLWVKPNAGVPHMDVETEQAVYDMSPADMAAYAQAYVKLGARVVGGCCGNTPEHIAAIAKAVKPTRTDR